MNFPISNQHLSAQFLKRTPAPYSTDKVTTECIRKKSVPACDSSPNLADLNYDLKLPQCRRNVQGCFANTSFNADPCSRRLALKMARYKSCDDLPEQYECTSLAPSPYDYTQIKTTYTSNARCRLARNEPIPSVYYDEHMDLYGKPPFVWGVRKPLESEAAFKCRRPISKYEIIY